MAKASGSVGIKGGNRLPRQKQYDMFYGMSARLVELPQKTTGSVVPVFSTALGAVFNTDCLNLFASLNDESIDTVFADPPFNIGKDYGAVKTRMNWTAMTT